MSRSHPIKRRPAPSPSVSEWIGTGTMVLLGLAAIARGALQLVWWANSKLKDESPGHARSDLIGPTSAVQIERWRRY
jgi:hypothetical protein